MRERFPYPSSVAIIDLLKGAILFQLKHKEGPAAGFQVDAIFLCCLDLNLFSALSTIEYRMRRRVQLNAIVVRGDRLPDATNHMPIRREVSAWEHFFEASNGRIDLF